MIRAACREDLDRIMEIWLEGNLQAHPFVDPGFWIGNAPEVREAIAQAEVWVWEEEGRVEAFAGLVGDYLAGLFVSGAKRGKGIGGQLLGHIQSQKSGLTLQVYPRNEGAVRFYQRFGFQLGAEQADPATGQTEWVMVYRA